MTVEFASFGELWAAVAAQAADLSDAVVQNASVRSFVQPFLELVFGSGRLEDHVSKLIGPVFAASCGFFSVLFLVLDYSVVFIRKRSFLQLRYRLRHGIGLLVFIPIAAATVGFLGFALDVLQTTRSASIAVGIGWPFLLAALFNAQEGIGHAGEDDAEAGGEALR
jgi:hypothetical protein